MNIYQGRKLDDAIPEDVTLWSWIFETGARRGGFRDALTDETLSYNDIKELATSLSTALSLKYGVKAGTHVSIFAVNSIWYPVAVYAAIRLGAIVTCSSPEYGEDETAYVLRASLSKVVFADKTSLNAVLAAARSQVIAEQNIIVHEDQKSKHASIHHLIEWGRSKGPSAQVPAWKLADGETNKSFVSFLSFTSGTTSQPKGVLISHHNCIAQCSQMTALTHKDVPKRLLGILPFYHITGIVQILQLSIKLNQEVIVMAKFNMREMLDVIVKHRCDELWMVPPLLIKLANEPIARTYDLSCVGQINTGAAPLAKEIIDKLAELYPFIRLRQAWGMTESTSALTLTPPYEQTWDNGHMVGKVVPETVIKIVDPQTGKECPTGTSGEVLGKGPQVTMGYFNNTKATRETYDSEGYLHTGDIGFMNDKGWLTIHDRLKDVIKVKGVGVAPAELEDLLLGHPIVVDAAVIGVPDDYAGEVPKAFVVLNAVEKSGPETAKRLEDYVRTKKSRPKWLAGGIEFRQHIPKSASGKLLRRLLRDEEMARRRKSKTKL